MTVKISAKKELGIAKTFNVRESNKNIRKTWELQKLMTKLSIDQATVGDDAEAFEGMLDLMLDVQTKVIAYITDVLNLDEAGKDKLEDLDFNETMTFAVRISSELLHIEAEPEESGDAVGLEG